MVKDGEERPGDGDASGEVALGRRESVGCGGRLEEEESEEDEDLGEDTGVVAVCVHAERLKCRHEDKESCEPMPEREWKVDPEFVVYVLSGVMLLDDVVDVRNGRADEESEDESDDVVATAPDADVDGVEDDEEWETPVDTVDDDLLAGFEELVDYGSEKEEVNDRPKTERPGSGSEIGLLASSVDRSRSGNSVNVATGEEGVDENVHDFE